MSEQLQYRMQQFEATPPPTVWEAIAARLDDDTQHAVLASKMSGYEAAPPASAWETIASSLEAPSTDTIPFTIRRTRIYRIAAAAIVIGILITAGWYFFKQDNTYSNIAAASQEPGTTIAPVQDSAVTTTPPTVAVTTPEEQNNFTSKTHRLTASLTGTNTDNRILKYATAIASPSYQEYPITISSSPIHDETSMVIRDRNMQTMNGGYLIISSPNGQLTRISSKFANAIRYLDNDENYDQSSKEGDAWKNRFQEWRRKIIQSAFIPSSGNFFDIADLKELIEDRQ